MAVELDGAKLWTETFSYSPAEVKSEETKTSSSGSVNAPGETGVNPNVGVALNAGGGGLQSETEEGRTENFEPQLTERTVKDQAPFGLKRATAAINLPRGYVLSVFKARYPDNDDPRDVDRDFVAVRDEIFASVRKQVKNVLQAEADADIEVDMFYDVGPGDGTLPGMPGMTGVAGGAAAVASTLTTTEMLKSYLPQVGLAGLAVFSKVLMMMMVRKTTRTARAAFPASEEGPADQFAVAPDGILTVPGGPVGRAEVSEGFLVGHEVDQETLQNQQLDEQVARLVDDNPEGVADLLRRWVEQDD